VVLLVDADSVGSTDRIDQVVSKCPERCASETVKVCEEIYAGGEF